MYWLPTCKPKAQMLHASTNFAAHDAARECCIFFLSMVPSDACLSSSPVQLSPCILFPFPRQLSDRAQCGRRSSQRGSLDPFLRRRGRSEQRVCRHAARPGLKLLHLACQRRQRGDRRIGEHGPTVGATGSSGQKHICAVRRRNRLDICTIVALECTGALWSEGTAQCWGTRDVLF